MENDDAGFIQHNDDNDDDVDSDDGDKIFVLRRSIQELVDEMNEAAFQSHQVITNVRF